MIMIKESNRNAMTRKLYCDAIHLPLQVDLPDGVRVTIDAMTDSQISDMYTIISHAMTDGDGYGVDEYPTEKDFRHEIDGGHSFNVCVADSGEMIGGFCLANSKFYRGTDVKVADPIIIVKRAERRRGVGEFIFRHVVQISRRLGYSGIYTDTFCNNVPMVKIIERTPGFRQVGYLPLGGKLPDGSTVGANLYFKDLRPSTDSVSR